MPLPTPSPIAAAHSAQLVRLIQDEIARAGGWISFERYMELALYAPGLGYYVAGATKFGDLASGGDFVTAPEISPLFAHAIAAQIAQVLPHTAPQVLEFGAGSGKLARALLAELDRLGVTVERYTIVELSADLRERQRVLLTDARFDWTVAPPDDFSGAIVANEVLDVMPVRLFVKRDGQTLERGVVTQGERFVFAEREAPADLAQAVQQIERQIEPTHGALPDGYASEIGLIARGWMQSLARWLGHGVALLIDYGFPAREYYHPQRLMGTVMCHYRQHAHADAFWFPGLNDITAHVDFTAMADAAHAVGLDVLGYTSQAHFLLNCGVIDLLQADHTHARTNEAHRLLSEAEMGELFKVLAVGRGLDLPLKGFSRGDRLHTL